MAIETVARLEENTATEGLEARMDIYEGEAQPRELSQELKDLLHGKTKTANISSEMAFMIPVDEEGRLFAVAQIDAFCCPGDDRSEQLLNGLIDSNKSDIRDIKVIGIYDNAVDDLLVVDKPYLTKLLKGEYADDDRLDAMRAKVGERMLALIDEQRDALRSEYLKERKSDEEEVIKTQIVDKMFADGISDARQLELPYVLDLDWCISSQRKMQADFILATMRGDVDQMAHKIIDEKSLLIGGQRHNIEQMSLYAFKHAAEINAKYGQKVEAVKAIRDSDAKTVTVKVANWEALEEPVKVDATRFRHELEFGKPRLYELESALERKGYGWEERDALPEPVIESISYRGQDIWRNESLRETERPQQRAKDIGKECQESAKALNATKEAPTRKPHERGGI